MAFKIVTMYLILPVFPEVFTNFIRASKNPPESFWEPVILIRFSQIVCNPFIISDAVT